MIKKKTHTVLILLSILTTCLFCGCEASGTNKADDTTVDANRNDYVNVYEVSEYLTEDQYDEYMNDDGTLFHRLLEYRHLLTDCSEFEFFAYCNNFIEVINNEIPEICYVNFGTEFQAQSEYVINGENITAAEAIQVSENYFSLFPIDITAGRGFQSTDFDYHDSESIPVILGEAYRELFNLGDTFEAFYIGDRRTFTVIGFADTESIFYLRSGKRMESYECYIVMPFENIGEDSASETAARAVLLQEICGYIELNGDRSSALQTIRRYLKDVGLEDWSEAIAVNDKSLFDKLM